MQTVYVGLSGGVDSSVTAALLRQQGYRVVGVHLQNWTRPVAGVDCPWKEDLADAKAVAAHLGIPFKVFDFQKQYKQKVVDYMVTEYLTGRTPNPDVMCNQEIKFKLFLEAALADGADLIATGHYARIQDGRLLAGKDKNKDQSYFLYRVTSEALAKSIMPIGELAKPEVRRLAEEFGLPTAQRPDSQGICFVGEVGIKDFLRQYIEAEEGAVIRISDSAVIGRHEGAIFYTTGQRHGLGIGGGKPYFVVGKDMNSNSVFVTDNPDDLNLQTDEFVIQNSHWINGQPRDGKLYQIRSRYRGSLIKGSVSTKGAGYTIKLDRPERAITAGQSAVVYDGDLVLGGGIISGQHGKVSKNKVFGEKTIVNSVS